MNRRNLLTTSSLAALFLGIALAALPDFATSNVPLPPPSGNFHAYGQYACAGSSIGSATTFQSACILHSGYSAEDITQSGSCSNCWLSDD